MAEHAGQFEADPRLLPQMKAAPFPYRLLSDRDFFDMRPVDTDRAPEVWRMPHGGALVEIWRDGDQATRAEVHTGRAALKLWKAVGLTLPAERSAAIARAFDGGPALDDALAAAFGARRRGLYPLEEGDGRRLYLITHRAPRRDAALEVKLDGDRVADYTLIEGAPAWARLRPYLRR